MEIKQILFPTDFSEGSAHALDYAIDMTKRYGAKLYLVYVLYEIGKSAGWYVPHPSMDEMYKDIEKSAEKELGRFGLEESRSFKGVERIVLKGGPHTEIEKI